MDIIRLIESIVAKNSFDLDLSDCPLVEDPKVMLPLVGALRHNNYFLSLKLTECEGNQQVLLMLASVVRFNTTLTKLYLANLDSPGTFEVLGNSLLANQLHAIQVLDISQNKIPNEAVETICLAFVGFKHALRALHLNQCQLSKRSLFSLFSCFKKNYGMSLSIEALDLSDNRLGRRGSKWLGSWMHMAGVNSNLLWLHLSNTALNFISIGRHLVWFTNLQGLDLSDNKLEHASVQLLTLFIETSMKLTSLRVSHCGLSGEFCAKILSVLLTNKNLSDVKVHMDQNEIKDDEDVEPIIEALARGSNIHTLSLSKNKFSATGLLKILCSLQQHKHLQTLILDQSYKGSKTSNLNLGLAKGLAMLVNQNSSIRALSLSGSFQEVATPFVELLADNASLEELDISNNQLKDLGASSIANRLRTNQNLLMLLLDDNRFSFSGWQAILQIFSTNKRLCFSPFPWSDYQSLFSSLNSDWQSKLQELLTTIQKMCSINAAHQGINTADRVFLLTKKTSIRGDFPTPTSVAPLAMMPEQMPVEIDEDPEDFTFGNDSSSDDETEIELLHLQDRHKHLSMKASELKTSSAPEVPSRESVPSLPPREQAPKLPDREGVPGANTFSQPNFTPPLPSRDGPPGVTPAQPYSSAPLILPANTPPVPRPPLPSREFVPLDGPVPSSPLPLPSRPIPTPPVAPMNPPMQAPPMPPVLSQMGSVPVAPSLPLPPANMPPPPPPASNFVSMPNVPVAPAPPGVQFHSAQSLPKKSAKAEVSAPSLEFDSIGDLLKQVMERREFIADDDTESANYSSSDDEDLSW